MRITARGDLRGGVGGDVDTAVAQDEQHVVRATLLTPLLAERLGERSPELRQIGIHEFLPAFARLRPAEAVVDGFDEQLSLVLIADLSERLGHRRQYRTDVRLTSMSDHGQGSQRQIRHSGIDVENPGNIVRTQHDGIDRQTRPQIVTRCSGPVAQVAVA